MKKTTILWWCRDDDGCYIRCPLIVPTPTKLNGEWYQTDRKGYERQEVLDKSLAREMSHLKLKPGEGPRKIEITAKFVD